MVYHYISQTYGAGVKIKVGSVVQHKPTFWFGKVCRPNRKNPKVIRIKFFGDKRKHVELDPAEIDFSPTRI